MTTYLALTVSGDVASATAGAVKGESDLYGIGFLLKNGRKSLIAEGILFG
ncbi:hypothetical protein [Thermaerobacillus caldiproteolyticus]|uniref:Uncharacterized protein n=2 Tax=Thermaerobacillus caldiproteolyticus TaxID=247480 RepID=A0A7W0BZR9_9BACL|nr:hypothetical protein [Anoxybacillus caldiproteolyticus]MBA2876323.1 hypothetical protein [Anoxybacillus caldiproteolyticus]